jgi:thioredoxin-like negative regulator of GroEL
MEDKTEVSKEELETFLRNVPNPVVLGVFGENCSPCEELEAEISKKQLPEKAAFAKVILGNREGDIKIADMLGVEAVPTVIAFCQGQELARTSDPKQLDTLLDSLRQCEVRSERPAN